MPQQVYLVELTAKAWRRFVRGGQAGPGNIGTWLNGRTWLPVDPAKSYTVKAQARRAAGSTGRFYMGVALFDAAGANISGDGSQWFYAANNVIPNTSWTTYTGNFGAATAKPFPGGAAWMTPLVILDYQHTLPTGPMDCLELWIEDQAVPGVPISADPNFRDEAEWRNYGSPVITPMYRTEVGESIAPETLTLRYATAPYMTRPSDTPAKAQYAARVLQPGMLRLELPLGMAGSITTSFGEIVLNNTDGALGDLAYMGMDGQPFRVLTGRDDQAYSSFTELLRGTMEQVSVDRRVARVRLRGPDTVFDRPVCRSRYLGNNALPNGVEGTGELAGQPKPRLYGVVRNIQPPCVNTSRLIYQVSVGPLWYANNVRDAGVLLTAGAEYTNQTDMETNAPAAGQYRVWRAGGMFRLGTAPAGVLTCDAGSDQTSWGGNYWWQELYQIAADMGVSGGDIQFARNHSFAQPDNWAGSWPTGSPLVGVWVNDLRTARQVMNEIAVSQGAWFGFVHWTGTPSGTLKFGGEVFPRPFSSAPSSPSFKASPSNIVSVSAFNDPAGGRGVPVWKVEITYAPNYTLFTPSMAPSIPPAQLGLLAIDRRKWQADETLVLLKHATAREVTIDSCFNDAGSAAVEREARRRLELWRYPKPWFEVVVTLQSVLDVAASSRPRLGSFVWVEWPELRVQLHDSVEGRGGEIVNAAWFHVMAIELDFARNACRLIVRQATKHTL